MGLKKLPNNFVMRTRISEADMLEEVALSRGVGEWQRDAARNRRARR
jgi:hypothetical protein